MTVLRSGPPLSGKCKTIQYNLLSVAKRFTDYESLGEMFRSTNTETMQLTLAERLWQLIIDVLAELAELFEIDTDLLMEKFISDTQKIVKLTNYKALLNAW